MNILKPLPHRILFFDHTAMLGGGEIALLHLVEQLDKHQFCPIVVLGCDGPLATRLAAIHIETYILPLAPDVLNTRKDKLGGRSLLEVQAIATTLSYTVRLARLMRSLRADLVHTNSLKADLIGGVASKLVCKPLIWHIRDQISEDYLPRRIAKLFRVLCRIWPTYWIANSRSTYETVASQHGTAASPGKSSVVHDGVRCIPELPPIQGDEAAAPVVGLVGRISPWKGQHIFIAAAEIVRKRFPCTQFKIIGAALFDEQEYERDLRDQVEKLQLQDCLVFSGFCANITDVISCLTVVVHASTLPEPFGQVVIEGMASGKPVVGTNAGGVAEIIKDRETGLLVPMGDAQSMASAICELLANPVEAREMGQRGRQRVSDYFLMSHAARAVENIYHQLLSNKGSKYLPQE